MRLCVVCKAPCCSTFFCTCSEPGDLRQHLLLQAPAGTRCRHEVHTLIWPGRCIWLSNTPPQRFRPPLFALVGGSHCDPGVWRGGPSSLAGRRHRASPSHRALHAQGLRAPCPWQPAARLCKQAVAGDPADQLTCIDCGSDWGFNFACECVVTRGSSFDTCEFGPAPRLASDMHCG